MRLRLTLTPLLAAGALGFLAGCMGSQVPRTTEVTAGRAAPQTPVPVMSPESRKLKDYYANVETALLAQGLLRTDNGRRDAPYTAAMLARNFKKVALYEEYTSVGGRMMARESASSLHRWEEPVRIAIEFGGVIPESQRRNDEAAVAGFADRLGRVSGHPVSVVDRDANFHVFIVDETARRRLGPRLSEIIPSIGPGAIATVTDLPRSSYCLVFAWDPEDDGSYARAVAVIRAEHPDLLRLSCIHEEIAQGMGLSNDFPGARPSIFNDDEEFGLLTGHDEELLRILYDRRLRPGMTAEEAMPIVTRIAEERMGGPT